ncbi:hypothetical protein ABBQ38_002902 [Trebouxia sp. C0009 RCD-2024]
MTPAANKPTKTLKLKGSGRVDNKGLAAGALTARSNLSSESADNGLNLERLLKAKEVFAKADRDKGGSLDVNEFAVAFKGVLSTDEGDGPDALRRLFARIDANADGTVDWREFSTYILLENDSAASLRGGEESTTYGHPTEPGDPTGQNRHNHMITSIINLPAKGHLKERYVTTGKDGTFRFWQAKDLEHCGTVRTGSAWLTAAAATPVSYKLCTASYARTVKIFDLQGMEVCGSVPELVHTPVCLDCWRRPTSATDEVLAVGDIGGYVTLFDLQQNWSEQKRSENRWSLGQVWRQLLHTDWVCQLQYISELNSILSCSLDKRLCLADVEARVTVKYLEGHTQGVRAVDWSKAYSFIASGGLDRNVMLWNPFQLQSMATLQGHAAAITHITINERSNQIISLSSDKVIKVWDIRNNRCLQTMTDKQKHRPEDALTCLLYDAKQQHLLSGSVLPKVWQAVHLKPDSSLRRHLHPVCQLVYNSVYHEAISADESGLICVWKVSSGALRTRWARAHGDARITSMAFDLNYRRLITGCESGTVKVWNFSSGECLKELEGISNQEITGIICLQTMMKRQYIVTVGWERCLVFYEDTKSDKRPLKPCRIVPDSRAGQQAAALNQGHTSDILTVAMQARLQARVPLLHAASAHGGNHTLVTGGYDGLVVVWNTDSGALAAHLSPPGLAHIGVQERSVEQSKNNQQYLLAYQVNLQGEKNSGLLHPSPDTASQVVFVGKRLPYVLAAVSADGCLRLWNVKLAQLLAEVQVSRDSLTAVCVDPAQTHLVAADSAGFMYTYSIAAWKGGKGKQAAIQCTAQWEAHKGSISALQWMQQGTVPGKGFIASASTDKGFAVWSPSGAHVGDFGQQQPWDWEDSQTWKDSSGASTATLPVHRDAEKPVAIPQLQSLQPVQTHDLMSGLLLRQGSDPSLDDCVYSSGDEMLPDCFTEDD